MDLFTLLVTHIDATSRGIKSAYDPNQIIVAANGEFMRSMMDTGRFSRDELVKVAEQQPDAYNQAFSDWYAPIEAIAHERVQQKQAGEVMGGVVWEVVQANLDNYFNTKFAGGFREGLRAAGSTAYKGLKDTMQYGASEAGAAGKQLLDTVKEHKLKSLGVAAGGTVAAGGGAFGVHKARQAWRARKDRQAAEAGAAGGASHQADDGIYEELAVQRANLLSQTFQQTGAIPDYTPVSDIDRELQEFAVGFVAGN